MGSSEIIPYSALLVNTAFALSIKLSLSQPMSFLTFTLPILSPIPLWGTVSEYLHGAQLPASVKPQQNHSL